MIGFVPPLPHCLVLTAPREFGFQNGPLRALEPGEVLLAVEACGLCRTDAKMWSLGEAGQPDLRLPRVLGHELVGYDLSSGTRFAPWPGVACGACWACVSGCENLCSSLQVLGFHADGGLASHAIVPKASLLRVPDALDAATATLAEPLGCAIHALNIAVKSGQQSIFIAGGGTLGVLVALAARARGLRVVVAEPDSRKRSRLREGWTGRFEIVANVEETGFDVALNATSAVEAFSEIVNCLKPRGIAVHFSGLSTSSSLSAKVINAIHYRELHLMGAYGCTRADMSSALGLLSRDAPLFAGLVERRVSLAEVPEVMETVLMGSCYRIVCEGESNKFG